MSKKCTPLWREAHFQVKMYNTLGVRTFFWQLRCRKSAHRRGAKHISKSKCTKHHMFASLLEVQMSFRVAGARDCAPCQKWPKREGFVAFLPSCLNMRTSKTEQVCETSSFFELDNIRNEAILRDFLTFGSARHQKRRILRDVLQKWKVECRADRLVPMRFAIFPVHLSKVLRLPWKIDARSYEVLRLSREIILVLANLHIWYSKMQPISGNQRPDFLTSLMNMSFVLRLPRKCIFADPLQMSHACHLAEFLCFWFCR